MHQREQRPTEGQRRSPRWGVGLLLMAMGLWVPPAWAHSEGAQSEWHVVPEATTVFPLLVGGGLQIQGPEGLRFTAHAGILPEAYLDVIHGVSTQSGWYDQVTADLISASLENALIAQVSAGWKPSADRGFLVSAGYTLATLGGGLEGSEVLSAVTGIDSQLGGLGEVDRTFDVASTVHLLQVELGWEFQLDSGIQIRPGIGGIFTVDAQSDVEPTWNPLPAFLESVNTLETASEEYLDETIERYVHSISLTLAVGYRF